MKQTGLNSSSRQFNSKDNLVKKDQFYDSVMRNSQSCIEQKTSSENDCLLDHILNYDLNDEDKKKLENFRVLREKNRIAEREDESLISKYIGRLSYVQSTFLTDRLGLDSLSNNIKNEKINRAKMLMDNLQEEWKENELSYYDRLKELTSLEILSNYDEFIRKVILEIDDLRTKRKFNYDILLLLRRRIMLKGQIEAASINYKNISDIKEYLREINPLLQTLTSIGTDLVKLFERRRRKGLPA